MRNLVIANMVLSAINIALGIGTGNWISAIGWGVALIWQINYIIQLEIINKNK